VDATPNVRKARLAAEKGGIAIHRLINHVRGNLVGWVALFVALGGTGYAAVNIPRNSVGAAQIRNRSITPVKFNPASIGGNVRAWAIIRANATVVASGGKPTVSAGAVPGSYQIQWAVHLPRTCATVANVDERSPVADETPINNGNGITNVIIGYVSSVNTQTVPSGGGKKVSVTSLNTFNQSGQPTALEFDVAIIC
jgi:hypothetical protein